MKNVFVDCGAYKGEAVDIFKKSKLYKPDFEIHCFEAHPSVARYLYQKPGIIFHPQAVWTEDTHLQFFINPQNMDSQGCSIKKEKTSGNLDKEHPILVEAIDFSRWIKETFKQDDNLVVKMNIEGAEYNVLQKMLFDCSIQYVKILMVAFHHHKMTDGATRKTEYENLMLTMGGPGMPQVLIRDESKNIPESWEEWGLL